MINYTDKELKEMVEKVKKAKSNIHENFSQEPWYGSCIKMLNSFIGIVDDYTEYKNNVTSTLLEMSLNDLSRIDIEKYSSMRKTADIGQLAAEKASQTRMERRRADRELLNEAMKLIIRTTVPRNLNEIILKQAERDIRMIELKFNLADSTNNGDDVKIVKDTKGKTWIVYPHYRFLRAYEFKDTEAFKKLQELVGTVRVSLHIAHTGNHMFEGCSLSFTW